MLILRQKGPNAMALQMLELGRTFFKIFGMHKFCLNYLYERSNNRFIVSVEFQLNDSTFMWNV